MRRQNPGPPPRLRSGGALGGPRRGVGVIERTSVVLRGTIALAVVGALAGAMIASPVGAAGTLTKAKVKRIATKVFNKKAPTLKDTCPASTVRVGTGCLETSNHTATNWESAVDTCAALNRRLPTADELWGARHLPGIDLAGTSGLTAEATSNVYHGGDYGFIAVSEGDLWLVELGLSSGTNPYRCVAPFTNA